MVNKAHGFIVWLTGLSGAGKTTVAWGLRDRLVTTPAIEILDGDDLRTTLCKGLGYSTEDRHTNICRIGFVAALLARNGVVTIVSVISPYREGRAEARRRAWAEGVPFIEVFLDAPLKTVIARDVKGLYKRALSGELPHFTGISDPYEPPEVPEFHFRTDQKTIDETVGGILVGLEERHLVLSSPERTAVFVPPRLRR